MAVADLLWACPACGTDRGISPDDGVCRECGTRFERGRAASIRATGIDGTWEVGSAADWLRRLPDPASLLEDHPIRTAHVLIRPVTGETQVFGESGFLNRVEVFGQDVPGRLRLEADRLVVTAERDDTAGGPEEHQEGGEEVWPLKNLTAVQGSSSSLQLKRRGHPLVAFRFLDDAVFLWEQLLRAALRDFYGRTGRGAILEFQPRIAVRKGEA